MKTIKMMVAGMAIIPLLISCNKNENSLIPNGENGILKKSMMNLQFVGTNAPTKMTMASSFSHEYGSPGYSAANANTPGGTFSFTEALLGIRDIEIKREDESFDDDDSTVADDTLNHNYDFNGNYVLDLLNGTSTPALSLVNFPAGKYNKVEAKSAKIIDGKNSISIKGAFTDTAAKKTYNFNFSTVARLEFEFESDSGFMLDQGKILDLLVNINLPVLFTGIDFSRATLDSNNVIVINESSNANLMAKIITNIRHQANGFSKEGDEEDDGHDHFGENG